jgi:hydroxyacylglutathione hydrolase
MSHKTHFFSTALVTKGTWAINGPANDLMYLVTGSKRALLVDTGMGIGDLAGEIRKLSDLPLMVVNTHGHPDHAGGNSNFDEVWTPVKDEAIRLRMCTEEYRRGDIRAVLGEDNPLIARLEKAMVHSRNVHYQPICCGQIFDLGDRKLEVIEVPGHTPGSICLLDAGQRILFSSDTVVATAAWLYLEHSLPLETYHRSLLKLKARENEYDAILPGHQPTPLGRQQLGDLIACAGEILSGGVKGELTRTFAGEGLLWVHGKAQIIYNPHNLHPGS